jgi:hypothetical protein
LLGWPVLRFGSVETRPGQGLIRHSVLEATRGLLQIG